MENKDKPAPKFKVGSRVKCDSVIGDFEVTKIWWEEASRWNYLPESGGYMCQVMFVGKNGRIDGRKNTRRFEESRLKQLESKPL